MRMPGHHRVKSFPVTDDPVGSGVIRPASLILTVLNEVASLPAFLRSVTGQQTLPSEIVIVDGGSTDGTVALLRAWVPPLGCALVVIESPGATISQGRNLAVQHAVCDRLLVTDAGTSLDPEWAGQLISAFDSTAAPDVVGGFFHPSGSTFLERCVAFTITPRLAEIEPSTFLPSSRSVGFTRAAWVAVSGYPEWLDYCEDLVFDLRLKERGFTFAFVGAAVVTWSARSSVSDFMVQYFRYARGDGKAGLWPRRHAARYAAYACGIGLVAISFAQPVALVPLVVAGSAYLAKFWRRVWLGRESFAGQTVIALLAVPVIVVAGDLAKMTGYPFGVRWRRIACGGSQP